MVALAVAAYAAWTHASSGTGTLLNPVELGAVVAAIAAAWLAADRREGWAFTATTVTMAACVLAIFVDLYPRVLVSTTAAGYDLTVRNTASGSYSLGVMTVVAVVALPFVLGYQAWSYYVFRRRLRPDAPGGPARRRPAGRPGARSRPRRRSPPWRAPTRSSPGHPRPTRPDRARRGRREPSRTSPDRTRRPGQAGRERPAMAGRTGGGCRGSAGGARDD